MKRLAVLSRFERGCPLSENIASIIMKRYVRKPRCDIGMENISEYFDEFTVSQLTLLEILQKLSKLGSERILRCRLVSSVAITTPRNPIIIIEIYCHLFITFNISKLQKSATMQKTYILRI